MFCIKRLHSLNYGRSHRYSKIFNIPQYFFLSEDHTFFTLLWMRPNSTKKYTSKTSFLSCHLSNASKLCKYKLAGTVAVNFGFENYARINCKAFAAVITQIYGNTDKNVQAQCYFFVLCYFKHFCITIVEGIRKRTTLVFLWNGHYCLGIIAFMCFFSSFIEYILTSSSCLSVLCLGGVLFKSARVSYTLRSRVYLVPVTLHLP